MLVLKITFKPNSRIGNGTIAATSKMSADISPKREIWEKYGDQELASIWANQVLLQRFGKNEPCTVINAAVSEE